MSVRQLALKLVTEGRSDHAVLRPLTEAVVARAVREHPRLDADVLPMIAAARPPGLGFEAWLDDVERRSPSVHAIVVHQDADRHPPDTILEGRWARWLERARSPARWILALPVEATESWLLADHETLAGVLGLQHRGVLDRLGRSSDTDGIRHPKSVVNDLLREANGVRRIAVRFDAVAEACASRADLGRLAQRSRSFATFVPQLAKTVEDALMRPDSGPAP